MTAVVAVFSAVLHADPSFFGRRNPYPLLEWDGTQWNFPVKENQRIIVIGDLHGDLSALLHILYDRTLIDEKRNWIGEDAQLVLLGDLNDRGETSRQLMDYVRDLTQKVEAQGKGGRVHTLLGNHEVLLIRGETHYLSQGDIWSFREFLPEHARKMLEEDLRKGYRANQYYFGRGAVNAVRGDTEYAQEIRKRPTMLKIGRNLFVHAGLEDWALVTDPGAINTTVSEWVKHYQVAGPRPRDSRTSWVLGPTGERSYSTWGGPPPVEGPLWTAIFSLFPEEHRERQLPQLKKILAKYDADRVFTGHIMTPDSDVPMPHPRFGNMVYMMDTSISRAYPGGRWASAEIIGDKVDIRYTKEPASIARRPGPNPRQRREIEQRSMFGFGGTRFLDEEKKNEPVPGELKPVPKAEGVDDKNVAQRCIEGLLRLITEGVKPSQ